MGHPAKPKHANPIRKSINVSKLDRTSLQLLNLPQILGVGSSKPSFLGKCTYYSTRSGLCGSRLQGPGIRQFSIMKLACPPHLPGPIFSHLPMVWSVTSTIVGGGGVHIDGMRYCVNCFVVFRNKSKSEAQNSHHYLNTAWTHIVIDPFVLKYALVYEHALWTRLCFGTKCS